MDTAQASITDLENQAHNLGYGSPISAGTLVPNVVIANGGTSGQGALYPNTVWSGTAAGPYSVDWNPTSPGGKLVLEGANADIEINGESLVATLRGIQDRLNILQPNVKLEQEWDQLRELGEQYRQLEKELEEKSQMWSALKQVDKKPVPK
jgi:hypothetical protein